MVDANIEKICNIIEEAKPKLIELSKNIHDNPELGNTEVKASTWQKEMLASYGLEIEDNFCNIKTAYRAVAKGTKPGPKIAILSEYDCLPQIGHACGHNLIAMMATGAGLAAKYITDNFGGEIHIIGTPAEETAGAKVPMAKLGVFKEYDVTFMAHPAPKSSIGSDTAAIFKRKVEFFGKTAHAAGKPWEGINALDAMISLFNMVNANRQEMTDDARIHGAITDGGEAPNIIPEYTAADFYIRSAKTDAARKLLDRFEKCVEGAALGTGTTFKISKIDEDYMDSVTNVTLANLLGDQYESLGHPIDRTIGFLAGSTDEGDVSYQCPAVQMRAGVGAYDDGLEHGTHTREFEILAGREENMVKCIEFSKAFAMTAYKLITEPDLLIGIKEEFNNTFSSK